MDDGFDAGFDADVERKQDDRPRGVSKKKLEEVDLGPKMAVFWREYRNAPSDLLQQSIPREALRLFCENIKDPFAKSYIIVGGNKKALAQILAWVKTCIELQSIEKFPDIDEPEHDPFGPTINILMAAEQLGVPAGSLSFHLMKRLNGCARKHLLPWDTVRDFYNIETKEYELGLRPIACASIFNAWWDARLDESVNPELMEELYDLRNEIQDLDGDLHEAYKKKEEEVKKKWAEKKAKKAAEAAGGGDGFDNTGGDFGNSASGGWDNNNTTEAVGGWDNEPSVAAVGGWDNPTPIASTSGVWDTPFDGLTQTSTAVSGGWNDENTSPVGIDAGKSFADGNADEAGIGDWAEEMNDHVTEPPQTAPAPAW